MNDLFVKSFNVDIFWIGPPEINRLGYRQVAPMDIYMLCPQHDFLFQGSDVKRFINWISALQVNTNGLGGCNDNLVQHEDGSFHRISEFYTALRQG
ncbi:MAG: hypothetical protein WAW41_22085 [Methylobacter sp.]